MPLTVTDTCLYSDCDSYSESEFCRYARTVFFLIDTALESDVDTQREGITIVQDMAGVARANFSRETMKRIMHLVQVCVAVLFGWFDSTLTFSS
jgi:hypothetical protein